MTYPAAAARFRRSSKTRRPEGPRKVIVGTTIFSLFDEAHPWRGLDYRLNEIAGRVDAIAADARRRYGRGPDLAVFPENSLNPRGAGALIERAVPLEGRVADTLGAKAREQGTWLVVCFNRLEKEKGRRPYVTNSAVLFDRKGRVAGV